MRLCAFTFATPVTAVASATCGGTAATTTSSGNEVTVNCTGLPNAQTAQITLVGVNLGAGAANVSVLMGVLLGDVNFNRIVSNSDVSAVKAQVSAAVTASNFRTDVSTTKAQVSTTLP